MLSKYLSAIVLFSVTLLSGAQDLSAFLRQVAENNPEIIAYGKLLEARRIEALTGNTPPGPEVSFGYMPGDALTAGVKRTWSVNQRFDFPSKYLLQKKINRNTIVLAEQEYSLGRLLVLLDARLTLCDYLFLKKYSGILDKRSDSYARLLDTWKKKLEAGEATILDYNRIALELSSVKMEKNKTASEIGSLEKKLLYLTGGKGIIPVVIEYPDTIQAGPDELAERKAAVHPSFLIPKTEYLISEAEVSLSRTGALPELSVGISSEIIPGEKYTGPVAGLSIPLWSNMNRVKSASAKMYQAGAQMNATIERLKTEVLKEYGRMVALKTGIRELREIIMSNGSLEYLDKALDAGEISVAGYFSFLGVVYDAEERLIEAEREYCKSVAVLNDYMLLEFVE